MTKYNIYGIIKICSLIEKGVVMRSLLVIFFALFAFSVNASTPLNQVERGLQVVKMKAHRFPGGMCYLQRKSFRGDLITFITTTPKLITVINIETCVTSLLKNKWEIVKEESVVFMDSLQEGRTENMSCLLFGIAQEPMQYQVRFSNFDLTEKQDEISECLAKAAGAKNKMLPQQRPPSADYKNDI